MLHLFVVLLNDEVCFNVCQEWETLLRELPVIEVHQMASWFSSDDEIECAGR